MSREQDLLFCKIAIQSGKVTQDVAQKCLALANRFETEGKKRPQVGAIFIKQNLMSTDDVQRIYGAVQKRMAAHSPSAESASSAAATAVRRERQTQVAAAPAGGRGTVQRPQAAARPAAPKAVRITHKAVVEKIEPTQLYLGIGFIVIFLICVGALLFMLLGGKKEELPEVKGGILKAPGTPPAAAPVPIPNPLLPEKTPAKAAADAKALLEKALRPDAGDKSGKAPKEPAAPPPEKAGAPPGKPPTEPGAPPPGEGKAGAESDGSGPEKKGAGVE